MQVQVLGAKRKTLAGFSSSSVQPHQGFITGCDLVGQTPPGLKAKALRLIGAKAALLARVDAFGQDPSGQTGSSFKVPCTFSHLLMCVECGSVGVKVDVKALDPKAKKPRP